MSLHLFEAWNIFRLVSPLSSGVLPELEKALCYIMVFCYLFLSSYLFLVFFTLFHPPLSVFTGSSTGKNVLFSKYIQSNLITAITFLLGWLTVLRVPLNEATFLLDIPKLLSPSQLNCTFTGALTHPSTRSSSQPLSYSVFNVYSPRQICHFTISAMFESFFLTCCLFFFIHSLYFVSPREIGWTASFLIWYEPQPFSKITSQSNPISPLAPTTYNYKLCVTCSQTFRRRGIFWQSLYLR